MTRFLLIHIFILASFNLNAQDVSVRSWFDSTKIFIGDQVYFNIEITHPSNIQIIYPSFSDTLVSGIEIINSSGSDSTRSSGDDIVVKQNYLVTAFDTGYFEIPPVYAEAKMDGGVKRYYSDYNLLEVIRVTIAPQDSTELFFDIRGPRRAGITFMEVLPWILLVLVLATVIFFAIKYFGKRGDAPVEEEQSYLPSEPIHILALRDLDKLDRKELWQRSYHKRYYSILTKILRIYIDRRYSISSMEMTTRDTLEALLAKGFELGKDYDILHSILITADLSKFAKHKPGESVNVQAIEDAREFVRSTSISKNSDINNSGEEVDDE